MQLLGSQNDMATIRLIYLPGKFGVRIEDVTVLTADGCMVLTKSPKELIIL